MALVMAMFSVACSDDDYSISDKALLGEGSVVTGSADVTPTIAVLNGSVDGLEGQSASAYTVGFNYGVKADALTEKVVGNGNPDFQATITGQPNDVIYYQAFVTLQGRVTYTGDVKSLVLTNTKAITGDMSDLTANSVKLAGSASDFTSDSKVGIVLSAKPESEDVRAGVRVEGVTASTFDVTASGLLPNTTYYYTAYVDLGAGTVYGEVKSFTTPDKTFDLDQDLVDLGLSTKWARCNLGATKATELGGLFGFGDMTGFNTSVDPAEYASADIYRTAQDVANKVSNGMFTMPTIDEFEELFRCCKVEWTTQDEVAGYKFTGPNGNSIFLPAAGSRTGSNISGIGAEGRYLSGSVNAADNRFAMSYLFNSASNARSTTPVYQALAIRPVSVAKNVPFKKELLYKTWEIDLTVDGQFQTFPGPTYFYGTDDSWRTVTNNEPVVGNSWVWEADFAGNSWAVGGDAKNCQGSITFKADGTVEVKHVAADGKETVETGTYTIDEKKKEITLKGAKVLAPANYTDDYVVSLSQNIRILSLTESSCQLMLIRKDDPCGLSVNMIPQMEKYGYTAKLTCYGQGADGEPADAWNSGTVTVAGGQTGTYTVTFNAQAPRAYGQVYILDIVGFAAAYPNAFVKIDAIKADGKDVLFDANKFFYGDIEGNGNFRIEMANIWGKGHNDAWNGLKDTPFRKEGGETTAETALAFNSQFEVTFTIVSLDADLEFNVVQAAVGLNSPWAMPGNWGKEYPAAIKVVKDDCSYKLVNADNFAMTLTAADCGEAGAPANGAVNYIDIKGIGNYFSGFKAELISVKSDGNNVPFTASKLKTGDLEGNGNYRIELHNIWGATVADPAFGGIETVEGNNCAATLGFTSSTTYTIGKFSENLFALPW